MRTQVPFNHDWLYTPESVTADVPDDAFKSITLPHTNIELPYHNFDDDDYQFISTYRKRFTLPEPLNGRRLFIDFEGAMTAATVSINHHTFAEHQGGYVPFSFDITDYLNEDGDNLITVSLDSTERKDIPPHGHTVDYMVFGGIYREVSLRYVEPVYIEQIFVRPQDVLSAQPRVAVDVWLTNTTDDDQTVSVTGAYDADSGTVQASATVSISAHDTHAITLELPAATVKLWALNAPHLYELHVSLETNGDHVSSRFGFREARFHEDGFYLNGERVQLYGLNRHQNYPYIGAAAPARLQRKDADILRYELGCNIVRTSHYPQSVHFLNRCDEIGLLVFEEIPGWQHIGDDSWKDLSLRDVRVMIERDRNHPSIIIWGVRINESFDDHDLYTQTNTLARQLDPTRQTGGVRYFLSSEFLEDVFTFNDFSDSVLEPEHTPHIITEFNGHMFPTKSFDNEERRVEHALRHAKIQSKASTTGGVAGAIGWCAFDYNTHYEFGAGDRICYHGVMDIFRLPKFAAYFYESQISPAERIVLRAATNWHPGDLKQGVIQPIIVFSNCDQLEVYIGDVKQGTFTPAHAQYPNLPHPPFVLTDLSIILGVPCEDLHLIGLLNGEPVAEQKIAIDALPHALILEADDAELTADGVDMTRVVFKIVDQYGNPLPYGINAVSFTVDGEADLIGANPFALVGGMAAVYIKARHAAGIVTVHAKAADLAETSVQIALI